MLCESDNDQRWSRSPRMSKAQQETFEFNVSGVSVNSDTPHLDNRKAIEALLYQVDDLKDKLEDREQELLEVRELLRSAVQRLREEFERKEKKPEEILVDRHERGETVKRLVKPSCENTAPGHDSVDTTDYEVIKAVSGAGVHRSLEKNGIVGEDAKDFFQQIRCEAEAVRSQGVNLHPRSHHRDDSEEEHASLWEKWTEHREMTDPDWKTVREGLKQSPICGGDCRKGQWMLARASAVIPCPTCGRKERTMSLQKQILITCLFATILAIWVAFTDKWVSRSLS